MEGNQLDDVGVVEPKLILRTKSAKEKEKAEIRAKKMKRKSI